MAAVVARWITVGQPVALESGWRRYINMYASRKPILALHSFRHNGRVCVLSLCLRCIAASLAVVSGPSLRLKMAKLVPET